MNYARRQHRQIRFATKTAAAEVRRLIRTGSIPVKIERRPAGPRPPPRRSCSLDTSHEAASSAVNDVRASGGKQALKTINDSRSLVWCTPVDLLPYLTPHRSTSRALRPP